MKGCKIGKLILCGSRKRTEWNLYLTSLNSRSLLAVFISRWREMRGGEIFCHFSLKTDKMNKEVWLLAMLFQNKMLFLHLGLKVTWAKLICFPWNRDYMDILIWTLHACYYQLIIYITAWKAPDALTTTKVRDRVNQCPLWRLGATNKAWNQHSSLCHFIVFPFGVTTCCPACCSPSVYLPPVMWTVSDEIYHPGGMFSSLQTTVLICCFAARQRVDRSELVSPQYLEQTV